MAGPPSDHAQPATAARVAYTAAAINAVAALGIAVVLRPGLPGSGPTAADRLQFIQAHLVSWRLGWLAWNAAAVSLLALLVVLAGRAQGSHAIAARVALLCAAAGLAADLSAETLMMGLYPSLSPESFPAAERGISLLTGYLGNGLYTVAGALLSWSLRRSLPRRVVLLAIPLWTSGLAASAATMFDVTAAEIVTTALVMIQFVVWTWLVARWLATNQPEPGYT